MWRRARCPCVVCAPSTPIFPPRALGLTAGAVRSGYTGREEIDATGKVVAPAWIDCHTHLDAQIMFDPWVAPLPGLPFC